MLKLAYVASYTARHDNGSHSVPNYCIFIRSTCKAMAFGAISRSFTKRTLSVLTDFRSLVPALTYLLLDYLHFSK